MEKPIVRQKEMRIASQKARNESGSNSEGSRFGNYTQITQASLPQSLSYSLR